MSTVVDASVFVAAAVDAGPQGEWAERILAGGGTLHAPDFVLAEATSALRRLERGRAISSIEATAAFGELNLLDIDLVPFEPLAQRIWALRNGTSIYDAWYVAVAEALDLPLATLDFRLAGSTVAQCTFRTPPRQTR